MKNTIALFMVSIFIVSGCSSDNNNTQNSATFMADMQSLGKKIFFDVSLSSGKNQSCASCHDPLVGFADPAVSSTVPISKGSVEGAFGNRNAPTAAYAFFSPPFTNTTQNLTPDGTISNYQGGQFLDGRRKNLKEQAKDPFLNPVEMNNVDAADVVTKVSSSSYADEFIALFGSGAFDNIDTAYDNIARSLAAFEASAEVNRFTSKFDEVKMGTAIFTDSEFRGFDLFTGKKAKCANCHTVPKKGDVLFTNHRFYNIGVPSNLNNPAVIADSNFVDNGLGATDVINDGDDTAEAGKFRTPTLRNIELTAPYMHNGVFQTLEDVVRHYDLKMQFATAEVNSNIAKEVAFDDFSSLGLSPTEISDIVNFMKTLTDQ